MALNEPPSKKAKTSSGVDTEKGSSSSSGVSNPKNILEDIKLCQAEIEKLNEKASEEILQIEQKYNKIRRPFFHQRNTLFKRLPKFWATALSHHPYLGSIIQEGELDCLGYISDCVAEEFDDIKLGYVITFHFEENPYFENTVLTKTMHLASSANARSESTPIKWKEGKDLIKKYSTKIASQGKRRRPPTTFFSWFVDNSGPAGDEVAETIKEDLWPSALQYYLDPYGDQNGMMEEEGETYEYNSDDEDECLIDEEDDTTMEENLMAGAEIDSIAEAELEGALTDEDSQSAEEGEDTKHSVESTEANKDEEKT